MPLRTLALIAATCAPAAAYDNGAPHSKFPPLGWSSWVALGPGAAHPVFDYCDEAGVKHAADAFVSSGLFDAGYRHFHLDDCWAGGRNSTGFVYPDLGRFPNGMKTVVDYVHSLGMVFGLYTCGGTLTCVGNRPGSKDHWAQDAASYAEWGVDWVKMDWCHSAPQDPKATYPIMGKALNSTGRPIHFNMCEWGNEQPWTWGDGCAQSWRMSGDHTPVWTSTKSIIAQSASIPAANSGRPYGWNDMDMLETGNYAQAAHANGKEGTMTEIEYTTEFSMWAISASPLVVTTPIMNCTAAPPAPGQGCAVDLQKQLSTTKCTKGVNFGCDGSMSTKTMWVSEGCRGEFSCDGNSSVTCDPMGNNGRYACSCSATPAPAVNITCVPMLSELQKRILLNKDVIAVNQDVTPQGRPVKDGDLTVWARHMSDGSVAVAFYNQEDAAVGISVQFQALGWDSTTKADVRDLWGQTQLAPVTGSFPQTGTQQVQPHQTLLYRLSKA